MGSSSVCRIPISKVFAETQIRIAAVLLPLQQLLASVPATGVGTLAGMLTENHPDLPSTPPLANPRYGPLAGPRIFWRPRPARYPAAEDSAPQAPMAVIMRVTPSASRSGAEARETRT